MEWRMKSTARDASPEGNSKTNGGQIWTIARFLHSSVRSSPTMHLMYTLNENGDRVYTLKVPAKSPFFCLDPHRFALESDDDRQGDKICAPRSAQSTPPFASPTSTIIPSFSAARFSPDDKFSRHRVTIKKRHGILLTQQPAKPW